MIEALHEIELGEDSLSSTHKVHFDPSVFAEENPGLSLETHRLDDDELEGWAYRCSVIRR